MTLRHTNTANAVAQHLSKIKAQTEAPKAARDPSINLRQLILAAGGAMTATFMDPPEVFDECLVGAAEVGNETVAVYNKMAVIVAITRQQGITPEEAIEFFDNSYGAGSAKRLMDADGADLPQMPVFLVDVRDL